MATRLTRVCCRGQDGGFTRDSIVERVPRILRSTISFNSFTDDAISKIRFLADDMSKGGPIHKSIRCSSATWKTYEKMYCLEDCTWLTLSWFFLENFIYELLLEYIGYRGPDDDPFQKQKHKLIVDALPAVTKLVESEDATLRGFEQLQAKKGDAAVAVVFPPKESVVPFFLQSLWGNALDLSLSGGSSISGSKHQLHQHRESSNDRIIINDLQRLLDTLWGYDSKKTKSKPTPTPTPTPTLFKPVDTIGVFLDNTGLELFSDLVLVDLLLESGMVSSKVILFAKSRPVFVSDALPKDIMTSLAKMKMNSSESGKKFAERVEAKIEAGSIEVRGEVFFNSPLFFPSMPDELRSELQPSKVSLVIVKGDANYRRLTEDARHLESEAFEDVVKSTLFPTSVVALRTLKSEPLVALDSCVSLPEGFRDDPANRVSGKFGLIQARLL